MVGFVVGYLHQQFSYTVYSLLSGFVLASIVRKNLVKHSFYYEIASILLLFLLNCPSDNVASLADVPAKTAEVATSEDRRGRDRCQGRTESDEEQLERQAQEVVVRSRSNITSVRAFLIYM